MSNTFDRVEKLIGKQALDVLNSSSILIVGVGGVGGYCGEMLARSGIGELTLIDCDNVDITNLNRQIIATIANIGKSKVEVAKQRYCSINENLQINAKHIRFNKQNIAEIFDKHFDFVIDAIDSVADKVDLIAHCISKGIPIISAMGSGNRIDEPHFSVVDLSKTNNDGLARAVRKRLRELGIIHTPCVCANTAPLSIDGVPGSIAYYPAVSGCVIASYVINKLIEVKND